MSQARNRKLRPAAGGPPPGMRLPVPRVDRRHRLRGAAFLPSPNHDARPDPRDVSLLVVHAISLPPGKFGGGWVERLFTNALDFDAHPYFATLRGVEVSAHLFIDRGGSLTQFVPFDRRAWHAGASQFEGRGRCNDFSVGVELEGCDDRRFEAAQYRSLARAVRALMQRYPAITPSRIVGHSDIAPGRKTDPGPHFDWARLLAELEDPR